ncbi:hypothetical protein LCDV1gp034 [Lymphocystis disease virus 1]|uniref:hypothetical protein n=1 Tax=Fish lymphocystis disease virus TaxID=36363 RepID=UPI0000161EF2|nr:hypothetical protein LCDV1gp034 [Lymphocystis disease virus 1]
MNLPSYEDLYSDGTLYVRKSWFHLKLKLYIENSKFTATVFNFGKPFKNYETHIKLYKNTDYTKSTHFIITFTGTTTTIVFLKDNKCLSYVVASQGRVYKNPQLTGFCTWKPITYKLNVVFL